MSKVKPLAKKLQRSRKNRKGLRLLIALTILSAATAGSYAFFRHYDYHFAAANLGKAETTYRAEGLPWAATDLQPTPPIAIKDNAAIEIQSAIEKVPPKDFESSIAKAPTYTDKKLYQSHIAQINKNASALNQIAKAIQKPKLYFERDWDLGEDLMFYELPKMRWFVRRLASRAEAYAGLGQVDLAIADIKTSWRLASLIGEEPFLMAVMASQTSQALVMDAILRCIVASKNVAAFATLEHLFSKESLPNFRNGIRGSLYLSLAFLREGSKDDLGMFSYNYGDKPLDRMDAWVDERMDFETKRKAWLARYMETSIDFAKAMKISGLREDELGKRLDSILTDLDEKRGLSNRIGEFFLIYQNSGNANIALLSRMRLTRAIIEALQFELKQGRLPTKLEEIPGTWIDPFAGKPFKLVQNGKSIRIFSLGPNLKDDGGLSKAETTLPTDDVVIIYPPLATKP